MFLLLAEYKIKADAIYHKCYACGAKEMVDMSHKLCTYIVNTAKKAKKSKDKDKDAKDKKREKKVLCSAVLFISTSWSRVIHDLTTVPRVSHCCCCCYRFFFLTGNDVAA